MRFVQRSLQSAAALFLLSLLHIDKFTTGALPKMVPVSQPDTNQGPIFVLQDVDGPYERRFTDDSGPSSVVLLADIDNDLRYLDQIHDTILPAPKKATNHPIARLTKRNYQHIWRNVQMRMPIYSQLPNVAQSKRSVPQQVSRQAVSSIYRLGRK